MLLYDEECNNYKAKLSELSRDLFQDDSQYYCRNDCKAIYQPQNIGIGTNFVKADVVWNSHVTFSNKE